MWFHPRLKRFHLPIYRFPWHNIVPTVHPFISMHVLSRLPYWDGTVRDSSVNNTELHCALLADIPVLGTSSHPWGPMPRAVGNTPSKLEPLLESDNGCLVAIHVSCNLPRWHSSMQHSNGTVPLLWVQTWHFSFHCTSTYSGWMMKCICLSVLMGHVEHNKHGFLSLCKLADLHVLWKPVLASFCHAVSCLSNFCDLPIVASIVVHPTILKKSLELIFSKIIK